MKRKLKGNSGETLVETLFALLVVVLAMTMLAGSIVSAARVNKGAEALNTAFQAANKPVLGVNGAVKHTKHSTVLDTTVSVTAYQTDDENKYCYYTTNSAG